MDEKIIYYLYLLIENAKKIKYKENRGKQRKTEDIRGFEL
jgi:hypothetical protein